jgi:hypothetical protein
MKIKLIESIRFRSVEYLAGAELDLAERDAQQLIAAKHAESVASSPTAGKTGKSPTVEQE